MAYDAVPSLSRSFLFALALCGVLTSASEATEPSRPNILFLVSDDQRPDTIAALGNTVIRTPHLDSLVRDGAAFTRAVCANPICTPSRAEILTGCTGFRIGVTDFGGTVPPKRITIAEAFQAAGYDTCYVGKWHNSGRPSTHGYQTVNGLFSSGGGRFWKDQVDAHGRPITGYRGWIFQTDDRKLFPEMGVGLTPDISARFADAAIEEIERAREQPWFLHVNFTAPHDPLLVPPGFENAYDPEEVPFPKNFQPKHPYDIGSSDRDEGLLPSPRTEVDVREDLAVYYAVISHLDQEVGRILNALEESGQSENTIVVYTSDHGLAVGSHGLRGKQNMYEHTINVPLLIRGSTIPAGKRFPAQVYLRDLYPTLCELAQVEVSEDLDGRSFVPVLQGKRDEIRDQIFGYYRDTQRMVRRGNWKLIHYPQIGQWQLFDIESDPDELQNRIDEPGCANIARQLKQILSNWQKDVGDPVVTARPSKNE
ncbi:sulfatase-like hydrolase/transferase [Rubinisphaera margarita]|uniref:sulfatase-like hydrolase/transferase n=1 Tax=Rubinisphaera margarita TaxID=2909586 RepID=UPI001EE7E824|nr:sulfatase-like hydrolase/transferase [Rubinisphaera margarita]MCG6155608.1 sulfatase-like hydrolase/transferase [Rubinisphaera margarita]